MKKNIVAIFCMLAAGHTIAQLPASVKPQTTAPPFKLSPAVKTGLIKETKTVYITPVAISNLCPTVRIAGDHDFSTNELYIECSVGFLGDNSKDSVLKAVIFISGKERGGDNSGVKGNFTVPVYTAPAGYAIQSIIADQRSLAFTFNTNDKTREYWPKSACTTYGYTLAPASLGFDLRQHMMKNMVILTRNLKGGDDFSETPGSCGCGFKIANMEFLPIRVVLVKK